MVSVDVYVETFGKIEEVDMVCYFFKQNSMSSRISYKDKGIFVELKYAESSDS